MCRTVLTRPDHRATDDDLRQRLLDAAAGLLDDSGIEAVTIRETARRRGVSHGAPRRHFPSRTSLLGHLAKRVAVELGGELDATDETPLRLARAYVGFAARRPHAFDLLLRHDLLEASGADLRPRSAPALTRGADFCFGEISPMSKPLSRCRCLSKRDGFLVPPA
ncbi:TetR/AcrR family transcriptional regulator [Actinoallomurus iriomotensis]|uniref:HTH tetR-type domain-containing protein n=1 Tax=Actinoallomurus iriomotensis TaxID=478107 RepID=A0A9W6RV07_9ACTN|nr:TetR/AcrR family transcriptional regulator [Actinoallomurus iriomotensis]GLY82064.1 hypothetical protein Airi01_103310 [Actinoallomurus iriomotensis]